MVNTKKPNRKRPEYKEDRNRFIIFLMKVHGWTPTEVKYNLELEWGIKMFRQRISEINKLYSHLYTKSSFKGYVPPEKL